MMIKRKEEEDASDENKSESNELDISGEGSLKDDSDDGTVNN